MIFSEALSDAFNGDVRITRCAWANSSIYVSVIEGKLCITGFNDKGEDDKRPHPLIITEQDYFSTDWEAVE